MRLATRDMVVSFVTERRDTGWTRAALELGSETIPLGADVWRCIVPRLEALASKRLGPGAGLLAGLSVSHVVTFAEQHWSIYAATREGGLVIVFQAPDGQAPFRTAVDDATLEVWRETLRRGP